jgi:branched-chain amino acid transport system ATP-binding protein
MTSLLSIKALSSGYHHQKVLHGIDLEIERGAIAAIIGPNGHGKSTLLKAISGLLPIWSGQIEFDGRKLPAGASGIARMGLVHVPQGDQLFTGLTVEENLLMGAFTRSDADVGKTLDEVYTLFPKLRDRRTQRANSLSGGERRMVGIGRGLMAKGLLMMVDEPSLGLAPLVTDHIYEVLEHMAKAGQSIIVVEEDLSRVNKVATAFHLLDGGEFAWHGSADELSNSAHVLKTYLGN